MKTRFKLVLTPCKTKPCSNTIEVKGVVYNGNFISQDNTIFIDIKNLGWIGTPRTRWSSEYVLRPIVLEDDYALLQKGAFVELEKIKGFRKVTNFFKKILGYSNSNLQPKLVLGKVVIILE
jgi:hypothetical protein